MRAVDTIFAGVSDMNRAVAFYRDVLGIGSVYESAYWTTLDTEGVSVALHLGGGGSGGWTLCFRCDDLESLRTKLKAAGVDPVDHETPRGPTLQFTDPDGNAVQAIHLR
ncbi:MAG: VOC family protein [Fimbriimonadaceae bacterium]|nr:VOC family protein [Fimbriimonadaceae bacterium]